MTTLEAPVRATKKSATEKSAPEAGDTSPPTLDRRGPRTAWLVLGGVCVVLAALLAVLLVTGKPRPASVLSGDELAAMNAAPALVTNLTTLSRAHFDSDWQRALDSTTGDLHTQQQSLKASTEKQLTTAKADVKGSVSKVAVESSSGTTVQLLVLQTGYRIDDKGTQTAVSSNTLTVTITKVGGRWLLSDISSGAGG